MSKPGIALVLGISFACWMAPTIKAHDTNREAGRGSAVAGVSSPTASALQPWPGATLSAKPHQVPNEWQFELSGLIALGALGFVPRPFGKNKRTR